MWVYLPAQLRYLIRNAPGFREELPPHSGETTVGKGFDPRISKRHATRPCATGCGFPCHRQVRLPARHPGAILRSPPPDSCHDRAKSGHCCHARPQLAMPHGSGFARQIGRPNSYRIFAKVNARNAGGSAPSRSGRTGFSMFAARFGPGGNVGRHRASSYRILAPACIRTAGVAAPHSNRTAVRAGPARSSETRASLNLSTEE